jgi:hypothetical protein
MWASGLAMNDDLGFTPEVFGFGAGIFFVGYILFEIPSNLALARFGARIWIARIMISWGLIATAMSFISGETCAQVSARCRRGGLLPRHHPPSHLLVSARGALANPRIIELGIVALPLFVSGTAFAWPAHAGPLALVVLALSLAMLGNYAAIGTFWSLPTSILTGTGAVAGPRATLPGRFCLSPQRLAQEVCSRCISVRRRGSGGETGARHRNLVATAIA